MQQQPEKHEILFVDDDEFILDALRAALRRQRRRWNMRFALGGQAGLDIIREGTVDVVVTDMRMPEVNGIDVLREAREVVPDAVRIVMSGQAEEELAVEAIPFTHQWLPKPTETAVLIHVIERSLVTRDLVHAGPARVALGAINRLPMMPRAYNELTAALAADETSVDVVTSIVATDPGLSARVLQMANSAFFGLPRRLDDVREAVTYLGFETIARLVFAAEIIHEADALGGPTALESFQATAMLTSRVAAEISRGTPFATVAGTAGMLHDIGRLALVAKAETEQEKAAATDNPLTMAEESERFGATHADIGGALLGVWGLPSDLVEAVAHHHEPHRIEILKLDSVVAVHVAQALVHEALATEEEPLPPCRGLDHALIERLGLGESLAGWREFTREAVATSLNQSDAA